MSHPILRVCVFCGSSFGNRLSYREAARELAAAMNEMGYSLVYGGAHVGLMGLIADTMLESGAEVIGVIPRQLLEKEIAHRGLTKLHAVETMHERKALMADLADAFVALPGAYGTLDELFEIITWAQLGIHRKPIGILNVEGYYDHMLAFLDGCTANGLLKQSNRELFLVDTNARRLLERMSEHHPAPVLKWMGPETR
ncbi:MAG: TIGR00730 family Rossman fold protein [Bryobacterales bacterium]|nr:TIGR00730 family Rossman fold protein [Bryobacterales bacterium]